MLAKLKASGFPVRSPYLITASNDPNHLLGRPNGYLSKVAFIDTRVPLVDRGERGDVNGGGSIEVFADHARAAGRAAYIAATGKASPALANEYDYVQGAVLLRVTGVLTPAQASKYRATLATNN